MNDTLRKWLESNKKSDSAKRIIKHLSDRCDEDPGLAEDLSDKKWEDCYAYIKDKARALAVNGCACVDDDTVYEWAEDYCRMTKKQLESLKPKPKAAPAPAPAAPAGKPSRRPAKADKPKTKKPGAKVISLFDDDDDPPTDDGQASLWDL